MSTLPSSANVLDFLKEAKKEQSKLRAAISGPSGSGKTFSAINLLMHMGCERIIVLDSEQGSAAKYANEFARPFKVIDNDYWQSKYDPRRLIAVLKALGGQADGIVVDSFTHFYSGPGGLLSYVDEVAKKAQARGGKFDTFGAWKEGDVIYNDLIQTVLALPCHFVGCMRAKSEYDDVVENGKKKKVKVGMASQMRNDFEYEFDIEGMMTMSNDFVVGKTRVRGTHGEIYNKPGANLATPVMAWLTDGTPPVEKPAPMAKLEAPKPAPVATKPAAVEGLTQAVKTVNAEVVKKTPVPPAAVPEPEPEEKSPDTENLPAATEPAGLTVADSLVIQINAAKNLEDLKAVTGAIKNAVADKTVTQEERNGKITAAYSAKQKSLKEAA